MKTNIVYFFLAAFLFSACSSDEKDAPKWLLKTNLQALVLGDESESKEGINMEDEEKSLCFELVYPISITLPNGSLLTGMEEDLWLEVKQWYISNPNGKDELSLNYPVDILWNGNVLKTISDDQKMEIVKKILQ